ncbi:hypothetical protein [Telmatospirillum sp.]|uniref:hypothetical protein n=1 Tax=Telmatospirillum sp. TaxID=2079197 RepID=UPI00284986C7|nr:hypothetical protein [Telmatospirillum sp.]MDR3435721.1 hypothetical protein [Telmatospirillum sp.]
MQVSGLFGNQTYSATSAQTANKKTSSFQDYLSAAQSGTTTGSKTAGTSAGTAGTGSGDSTATSSDSSNDAVQEFWAYMKETPEQRMFDSWLGSQHITKAEYAALSPADQKKLMDEFRRELEQKIKEKLGATSGSTQITA